METAVVDATETIRASLSYDRPDIQELIDVIKRHESLFLRIALGVLKNQADAEDAIQSAFLSAYVHLDQFKGQAKMSTWLTSIVINSARMILRRRARMFDLSLGEEEVEQTSYSLLESLSDNQPNPEDIYMGAEIEQRIARFSTRLQPNLRKVVHLRVTVGLSIHEIAEIMGLSKAAVKSRLSRARTRLRTLCL